MTLWTVGRFLVNVHHDSSVGNTVAVWNTTFEVAKLVISPDMIRQTTLSFHHLGALSTLPAGQVAMPFPIMGLE